MDKVSSLLLRLLAALALVAMTCTLALAEPPRSRAFSKDEIAKMAETRAVLTTPAGDIELKFYPDVAPNHVDNFIELAKKGFYDGSAFHRVIPGFMIQGGDPETKKMERASHGTGGPGYTLKAEFSMKPHVRGTLSMARMADPDSGGSQFFICVAPAGHLNGQYTVFGEVVSGMEAVDKIVNQPVDGRRNPIERMTMKVKVIEPAAKAKAKSKDKGGKKK